MNYPVAILKKSGSRHTPPQLVAVLALDDFLELCDILRGHGVW